MLLIFSFTNLTAYAFNSDYIGNAVKWNDIPNIAQTDMNAACKYIIDNDEGCFYLYLFYNKREFPDIDKIEISFRLVNDKNIYNFSVDKYGFTKASSKNAIENIYLQQQFNSGKIFVGFQLENPDDRKLDTKISCEFASGDEITKSLISGKSIEMFVPVTEKSTSVKYNTTKTRTTNAQNESKSELHKITKTAKSESTKDTNKTINTTKFKATGRVTSVSGSKKNNAKTQQTKFHAQNDSDKLYSMETTAEEEETTEFNFFSVLENRENKNGESADKKYERSKQATAAIIVSFVILVTGISLVIISALKKKTPNHNTDEPNKED